MTKGKFALGALIGIVAGVVAGVLTAPKSGKETRADIKGKAAELKHEAAKRATEARDTAVEVANDVKHKAEGYIERGEHATKDVKKGFFSKKK